LGVHEATNQHKLQRFAKSTRQFWRALNLWLSENDFLLGRPTAKPLISHWKYASYALSQALVRETDRERFTGLFEKYDLVPGDTGSDAEMAILIGEWITSHGPAGPNSWLRKLWSTNDLRERVIAAALDALETWERSAVGAVSIRKKARLRWQLGFTGFPRKRAHLVVAVTRGGQSEILIPDSSGDGFQGELSLVDGPEPETWFLGPLESINLDLLLLQSRSFKGAESGISYNYVAKPIVALARSPDGPTFREVSRVSLFDEHVILCHEGWLDKVEGHLSICARPGYTVQGPSNMQGIPEGWCILRGVEVVRSVDGAHDNFHALNPIGSPSDVACTGGLKLGHGTWHADAPPMVEATSVKAGSQLAIVKERFGEEDEVLVSSNTSGNLMEVYLSQTESLSGANLRAVVQANKVEVAEISFSIRSADVPRPLGKKCIFHPATETRGFSLEEGMAVEGEQAGLEGCLIHGRLVTREDESLSQGQVDVPHGMNEAQPETSWQRSQHASHEAKESCVIRGYHHWIYEPFEKGDDRFEAKMAECKNCHVRALSRSREVARKNWRKIRQQIQTIPSKRRKRGRQHRINTEKVGFSEISQDTIYDGLCYLGFGNWRSFQRLVSRYSEEPWFSHSFASDLFALGNLETLDAFQSSTSAWSIPPPVLVIGHDNSGYLAGFHSRLLLEHIGAVLGRAGANYEPISVAKQVTVHRWSGLVDLDIEGLLGEIADPHGREVAVERGLGRAIASNLPPLDEAWLRGVPMHVERPDGLAKFDVRKVRWAHVDELDGPGAYRIGMHGVRYVYCDEGGATRQVGHRVAKTLAARSEGAWLHGYDIATKRFTAALGAEPPGLFARAIVASGGVPPTIESGRVHYENVDPSVAALVLNKMYDGS